MDWSDKPLTPGGKKFNEWLKARISEDIQPPQPISQVNTPTSPKDAIRRKEVQKITSNMMMKNNKLVPGKVKDNSIVLNAMKNDPNLSKMDTSTQQDVTNFFLAPSKD